MQERKMDTFEKNRFVSAITEAKKQGTLPEPFVVHQYGQAPHQVYRGKADWKKEDGIWPQPEKKLTLPDAYGFPMFLGDFKSIKAELAARGISFEIDKSYEFSIPPEHRVSDPDKEEEGNAVPDAEFAPPKPDVDLFSMNKFEREDYLSRQKQ